MKKTDISVNKVRVISLLLITLFLVLPVLAYEETQIQYIENQTYSDFGKNQTVNVTIPSYQSSIVLNGENTYTGHITVPEHNMSFVIPVLDVRNSPLANDIHTQLLTLIAFCIVIIMLIQVVKFMAWIKDQYFPRTVKL